MPKRYRSEENAKKLMELACSMKVTGPCSGFQVLSKVFHVIIMEFNDKEFEENAVFIFYLSI